MHGLILDDVLALSSLSPELKECLIVPLFADDEQREKLQIAISHLNIPSHDGFERWMTDKHHVLWENYKRFLADPAGSHPKVEKDIKETRREYLSLMAKKGYDRKTLNYLEYLEGLESLCLQKKIFAVF